MSVMVVACGLFALGLYGVLVRKDIVAVLASVEVMIGGALVLLVGLGAALPAPGAVRIEGMALLILVLAAAEAALGLALLVMVARRSRTTRIDELTEVKG